MADKNKPGFGFDFDAVYSDESKNFRNPWQPSREDYVSIRLRVGSGCADSVKIITDKAVIDMKPEFSWGVFDYYIGRLPPCKDITEYYFRITYGGGMFYYTRLGVIKDPPVKGCFSVIRDFFTPEWAVGAVMYQIFTDRFARGTYKNDVLENEYIYLDQPVRFIKDWDCPPEAGDIRNFYGGDIQGVMNKLGYLKELGVEAIYLNPVFVSPSTHKYDIQDYDYVDPHLAVIVNDGGEALRFEKFNNLYATKYIIRTTDRENLETSNRFFAQMIYCAHEMGIKVLLDGVFNHCGANNKWLDKEGFYERAGGYPKGAYGNCESPYHCYFYWKGRDCTEYEGWWGHKNHPKLNLEASPELYGYFMDVAAKWVLPPYNADGWRLDVAADLGKSPGFNHKFWKDFRKSVKNANPEAFIFAEHYGDPKAWLLGDEWDSVMNYDGFMEPLTWFLTGMEKHSEYYRGELLGNAEYFAESLVKNALPFSAQTLYTAMNEISNHDHSRFLTRTNKTPGRLFTKGTAAAGEGINLGIMRTAVMFQMTWVGAPTIYYGDEAGLCGWTDPDNRRTYPWGRENKELLAFHKDIIRLRRRYDVLKTGSVKILYKKNGVFSFGRFDFRERVIILMNSGPEAMEVEIPVWQAGVSMEGALKKLMAAGEWGYDTEEEIIPVKDGRANIKLSPYGSVMLAETDKGEKGWK